MNFIVKVGLVFLYTGNDYVVVVVVVVTGEAKAFVRAKLSSSGNLRLVVRAQISSYCSASLFGGRHSVRLVVP